jgi:argininosuccinate lyase
MDGGSSPQRPWEHVKADNASDPDALRFCASLVHDRRLYRQDILGSRAHARMLRAQGLISEADHAAIDEGLCAIEAEIEADPAAWPGFRDELEDVHMCIEHALIERIGEPGRKLHTGRSRNDQIALDMKLWMVDAAASLRERFTALYRAFVELARRDGGIVMPGYTHLQRAQPIVVGAELVAWLTALDRCERRLEALLQLNRESPLGSGALAGSALPLDRIVPARVLGLGDPGDSSIDATAGRDGACDFLYSLSMTAVTLSRWAEQWILYASSEFGFLRLDDRYITGSSMMPQKQNPDILELIRGRCGAVTGHLHGFMTVLKGLPVGYGRDLQEDKRHVFAAYDVVSSALDMAARVVATTRFDEAAIGQGLDRGFLDATSLAEYLVEKGVAFRTAHQVVGRLVRRCRERGLSALNELEVEAMNEACAAAGSERLVGEDVRDWLGPAQTVWRYRTTGSAGPAGVEAVLARWRARLGEDSAPPAWAADVKDAAGAGRR